MALVKSIKGISPQWGEDCFFAENATVIGDVIMGDECSLWYQTVVRGDVNKIRIGHRVNIQDGSVLHVAYETHDLNIGNDVSIGHRAIVHGCDVEDEVLIGMGSVVMDGAVVRKHTVIAAGAVVLEGMECESGWIYAGVPARKVKQVPDELKTGLISLTAEHYVKYSSWYLD